MKRIGMGCGSGSDGVAGLTVSAQQRLASPTAWRPRKLAAKQLTPRPECGRKWIEISYGRPIARGRDLWGQDLTTARMILAGAPVWRAGNVSTRQDRGAARHQQQDRCPRRRSSSTSSRTTDVHVRAGWRRPRMTQQQKRLWGAFGYTPAKDASARP